MFSHNDIWSALLRYKAPTPTRLWPKIESQQTVALLLLTQHSYRYEKGAKLHFFVDANAVHFKLSGDISNWVYCYMTGTAVGRLRPLKAGDPPLAFTKPPAFVFEIRLHPTKGYYGIYDETDDEDDEDGESRLAGKTSSFIFTAPGVLSLRRSRWEELKQPWSMKASGSSENK